MTWLTSIAVDELHRRKASIDAAVAAGRYPRSDGETNLRLWLSIALVAGARPGECAAVVGEWQGDLPDASARHILLADGPPRHEYLAELARARNEAAKKARAHPTQRPLLERHTGLECLAIMLGAPSEPESTGQVEGERLAA